MIRKQRNIGKRELDFERIAALYLEGKSQRTIAAEVGISQSTVCRDLEKLRQEWREKANIDFDQAVAEQLAKIDHLEATYWDAWERSLKPMVRTATDEATGKEQRVETSRDGDPRYMEGVMNCIRERSKLLGLYLPQKFSETTPEGAESASKGGTVFLFPDNGRYTPVRDDTESTH